MSSLKLFLYSIIVQVVGGKDTPSEEYLYLGFCCDDCNEYTIRSCQERVNILLQV